MGLPEPEPDLGIVQGSAADESAERPSHEYGHDRGGVHRDGERVPPVQGPPPRAEHDRTEEGGAEHEEHPADSEADLVLEDAVQRDDPRADGDQEELDRHEP